MRWLSRFAILFYLSLLCTPQAFAVHDIRLSPLADTQLQAVLPALPAHVADNGQADDSDPPVLPAALTFDARYLCSSHIQHSGAESVSAAIAICHQPRAPPVFSHA